MGHRQRSIGRVLTAVGLLAGAGYLVWRASSTMADSSPWLSLPVLVMEAAGFLGTFLLAWAVWPEPHRASATLQPGATDVVVRVDEQPLHDVRATLVALRAVRNTAALVIVDLAARAEVGSLAAALV